MKNTLNRLKIYITALSIIFVCGYIFCNFSLTYAKNTWGDWGSDPIQILEKTREEANSDYGYEIQETALDETVSKAPAGNNRLTVTLSTVINGIHPYLQWLMYFGLSLATILLIYNGFLLVTDGVHNSGDLSAVKKNISKIIIGVFIMTGVRAILKIILALLNILFNQH